MAFYCPEHSDLPAPTRYGHAQWYEPLCQLWPNNTINGVNMVHYAHQQYNTVVPFPPKTVPHFPPPNPLPIPLHAFSNPQPSVLPLPFLNIPDSHNPPVISGVPSHPPAEQPNPSAVGSTSTSPTASLAAPVVISSASTSQRAKFPCRSCGKMCTSRPRAYTCLLNHTGAKPFTCNGACGIEDW
ncbi:hypothetical protein CPB86DRAFT_258994 [Serendipita vermifera]|nr:hypothetical protein CPB86DRAFT_258994 [Serendipita vermifera]